MHQVISISKGRTMEAAYYRLGKDGMVVAGDDPCATWMAPHDWQPMGKYARCAVCGLIRYDGARMAIVTPGKGKRKR